jgi:phage protein|nr:MAG TPA: tail completion protein [Caudoviricetes sp.]
MMILETIRNFLVTKLDCKVVMERAAKMPDKFVLIEQTGSGKRKHLKSSTIVFQSYDSTLYKAAQLNEAVKAAVEMLVELDDVSGVSLNSDYIYTDTESKKYRYQAVFDIKHY